MTIALIASIGWGRLNGRIGATSRSPCSSWNGASRCSVTMLPASTGCWRASGLLLMADILPPWPGPHPPRA